MNILQQLLLICIALTVASADPTAIQKSRAVTALQNVITRNALVPRVDLPFIAGFVRLAFHDCIGDGGCDGCIDHGNPSNGGLQRYTVALDALYAEQDYGMSRADFYAFAAVVALEMSTSTSEDKFEGVENFEFGRTDCVNSPAEDSLADNFPSGHNGIDVTLAYFQEEFPSFTTREVVALLGAHTLGRARMEDSGFEGRWTHERTDGKVDSTLAPQSTLDNQYYVELMVPWKQLILESGNNQWFDLLVFDANTAASRINPSQPSMLLNSDFCFVFNFTRIDEIGSINCRTCPPIFPGCCKFSSTRSIVQEFSNDNEKWVNEFEAIFKKMINTGLSAKDQYSRFSDRLDKLSTNELEDIMIDLMENN